MKYCRKSGSIALWYHQEVEAFKWTGGIDQIEDPEWAVEAIKKGDIFFVNSGTPKVQMKIRHPDSLISANRGDYIVLASEGKIYPYMAAAFESMYEPVGQ